MSTRDRDQPPSNIPLSQIAFTVAATPPPSEDKPAEELGEDHPWGLAYATGLGWVEPEI